MSIQARFLNYIEYIAHGFKMWLFCQKLTYFGELASKWSMIHMHTCQNCNLQLIF